MILSKSERAYCGAPASCFLLWLILNYVKELIEKDYSPEQIVGRSKVDKIDCVSHERIYQFIWQDKKDGGRLYKHLKTQN